MSICSYKNMYKKNFTNLVRDFNKNLTDIIFNYSWKGLDIKHSLSLISAPKSANWLQEPLFLPYHQCQWAWPNPTVDPEFPLLSIPLCQGKIPRNPFYLGPPVATPGLVSGRWFFSPLPVLQIVSWSHLQHYNRLFIGAPPHTQPSLTLLLDFGTQFFILSCLAQP